MTVSMYLVMPTVSLPFSLQIRRYIEAYPAQSVLGVAVATGSVLCMNGGEGREKVASARIRRNHRG